MMKIAEYAGILLVVIGLIVNGTTTLLFKKKAHHPPGGGAGGAGHGAGHEEEAGSQISWWYIWGTIFVIAGTILLCIVNHEQITKGNEFIASFDKPPLPGTVIPKPESTFDSVKGILTIESEIPEAFEVVAYWQGGPNPPADKASGSKKFGRNRVIDLGKGSQAVRVEFVNPEGTKRSMIVSAKVK